MKNKMKKSEFVRKLLIILFPKRCPCCENVIRYDQIVCNKCQKEFNGITYRKYTKGGYPCVSAVPYDGVFARAILGFKFYKKKRYSHQLASIIAEAIKREYATEHFDLITFVPLHENRYKERGYNQSELLSRSLSEILDIPVVATLRKTRNNLPQHDLKAKKRAENVKGAYKVIDKDLISGKAILLLDDIITTGNTLGECARTLDQCSPCSINCITFAITVVKNDLK